MCTMCMCVCFGNGQSMEIGHGLLVLACSGCCLLPCNSRPRRTYRAGLTAVANAHSIHEAGRPTTAEALTVRHGTSQTTHMRRAATRRSMWSDPLGDAATQTDTGSGELCACTAAPARCSAG